uniref:Uncharacterized protein n=1 Tax=Aegilops tauschii subsp. strangulata TaxID=200361 RepID=A0A453QLC6_AEGTS
YLKISLAQNATVLLCLFELKSFKIAKDFPLLSLENSTFRTRWLQLDELAGILLSGHKQICYLQLKLNVSHTNFL